MIIHIINYNINRKHAIDYTTTPNQLLIDLHMALIDKTKH